MSQVQQTPVHSARPRKRRRLLWNSAGLLIAVTALLAALWLWLNSNNFENLLRRRIIAQLETGTGGRVEIRSFHWRPINLAADAGGIVIHGLEDPAEAPYVQVERVRVGISIMGFFSPRILLRELQVLKPQIHLIVYPDGSTNQPRPRNPRRAGKPVIETVFDLQAGHVSVEQGSFDFYSRASGFDPAQRYLPLEFQASDVSLLMKYVPEEGKNPDAYRIEAGVRDLDLLRGGKSPSASAFPAYLQASFDLTRNSLSVRSLRLTERTPGEKERVLNVSGTVSDFAHLRWAGKISGEFDLHLLNPILDYPFTPEGVARMDLSAAGDIHNFRIEGPVHVDNGAYIDPAIKVRKLQMDFRVQTDSNLMRFSNVIARFPQGGQLSGELQLEHWVPHLPLHPVTMSAARPETRPQAPAHPKHFWNRKSPSPLPLHRRRAMCW